MVTRVTSPAQVLLCKGCCCGRPDRGYPDVPVDRIKAAWKAEKLNRSVQLTISGCLGPCDLPNVAVLVTSTGTTWYGLIQGDADYDALIDWARSRKDGEQTMEPEGWRGRTFNRFANRGEEEPIRR
ncbi:MAG: hypothetical protein JWN86_3335 [Planctomycetota bacterium]|nr:hypothetical protein [Planctomycetota bacterium]